MKRITRRGPSWSTLIDMPPDPLTGKRRQKRITADTKKEVETQAAELINAIAHGGFGEADAARLTVTQYLARWLDSIGQSVRPTTQHRYSDLIRQHIEPLTAPQADAPCYASGSPPQNAVGRSAAARLQFSAVQSHSSLAVHGSECA